MLLILSYPDIAGDPIDFLSSRAIALSLQEASKPKLPSPIIISDDEDDDAAFERQIQRAIEASKTERSSSGSRAGPSSRIPSPQPPLSQAAVPPPIFLSERALMEKERLERQKRLRPDTSFDEKEGESIKKPNIASTAQSNEKGKGRAPSSSALGGSSTSAMDQLFWDGEVRQVANRYAEPRKDGRPTFRLTEVLGKVRLVSTVNFMWHN